MRFDSSPTHPPRVAPRRHPEPRLPAGQTLPMGIVMNWKLQFSKSTSIKVLRYRPNSNAFSAYDLLALDLRAH
jgi:hypothetical protein